MFLGRGFDAFLAAIGGTVVAGIAIGDGKGLVGVVWGIVFAMVSYALLRLTNKFKPRD